MIQQLTAPKTGDMFDAEGFRIATDIATIVAHAGEWAAIVLPGKAYATSVSVRTTQMRTFETGMNAETVFEIGRDGKGDTLLVNLDPFMTQLISYVEREQADRIAGGITFDGVQTGVVYEQGNWGNAHHYHSHLHALVVMAGMFLV